MPDDLQAQLLSATNAIVTSVSARKLVVAGPGAGKTFLFRSLLGHTQGGRDERLVFTLINNLKDDLQAELGHLGSVFTFHGYCRHLLHRRPDLREGLSETFHYYPPLIRLIASDWEHIYGEPVPQFYGLMRDVRENSETDFFLDRSNYYDATSFDDSVFRVYKLLRDRPAAAERYNLILVDEFQDFNRLEAEFIELLGISSPIVIAGDDDQALYTFLRGSRPDFIRALHSGGVYANFPLPFCMRCTEAIVNAVDDVVSHAVAQNFLSGRIAKPYLHFPPKKGEDSARYPRIAVVNTSVQSSRANYFGRYIAEQISRIPAREILESLENRYPTVLIIGSKQYLRPIREHLEEQGYSCEASEPSGAFEPRREEGLKLLREDPDSPLGWRIILEIDKPAFAANLIIESIVSHAPLRNGIPTASRDGILKEAAALADDSDGGDIEAVEPSPTDGGQRRPTIRLTSFEGSKGLSAQHVFIVGLHEGDLPRDSGRITDLEICKFLVALTRTRKRCHLLDHHWLGQPRRRSPFIDWIQEGRKQFIRVDRRYWQRDQV